ncbi:hypothetical protein TL16_g07531 [Triparma laevis f. inornata]|uniref:Uncharacterized protein n=2 Tax=Triparma laevis TaxID=1534972 RepID=A0A9W7KSG7_9STRA|nr:hypothetical protein TL16_g07531 [Triparma laevis f. inornata]GMI09786.1 hypothetical protein TrLO_g399 [Triparma laevis f. longispina]
MLRTAASRALRSPYLLNANRTMAVGSIDKIIIANRGEITCRIMDTCRKLGVKTVAVYSEADANARHVQEADEAYCVGPAEAKESYLRSEKVLAVAQATGAKALHPGYGFLSENAAFADACNAAGVTFMGPPSSAIEAMGSKSNSKEIMIAAGVPCTPGYHGSDQEPEKLKEHADDVGYPVLIKAVMGGGGKGMRLVHKPEDFLESLESCKRESINSFGDDKVLLERYLTAPRHVEVQIFGDTHGNAVHLHERDCSVQRRHQKVLEEAPAPGLDQKLRERMGEAAVLAAKAVGYVGAGTVEFLMEAGTDDFFFCEMNTRLQVEHPVTELVTGVDLVEWQLRIAAGEPLPLKQEEIVTKGHAIEARIYAENPARDFLPATGHLFHLSPPTGEGVRVDTGVRQGDDVSIFYDPMISKLICYAENRDLAIEKLLASLKEYEVVGMPTNIPFVEKCAAHEAFRKGGVTTGFLEIYADDVQIPEGVEASDTAKGLAALALAIEGIKSTNGFVESSFRLHGRAQRILQFKSNDDTKSQINVWSNKDGSYDIEVSPDTTFTNVKGSYDVANRTITAVINNKALKASAVISNDGNDRVVSLWSQKPGHFFDDESEEYYAAITIEGDVVGASVGSGAAGAVLSPMPGKIVAVNYSVGDLVKAGDVVMILEAMKMEHPLIAPGDGVIGSIGGGEGDLIQDGQQLFVVEAEGDEAAA